MNAGRCRNVAALGVALSLLCAFAAAAPAAAGSGPHAESVIFFAADGMRRDLVGKYAAAGSMPAMQQLIATGASAPDGGLRTQAPATSGPGSFSLATGAWSGVHGAPNNAFHINGQTFNNRASAFDSGVVQAETLAQAAERGGKRVAQIEWAGGRAGVIAGPTIDFREFFSGRGVATNYVDPDDDAGTVAAFALQFDHPAGFAGQAPFALAAPAAAAGWSNVPASYSPAMEMRLRVLDFGADKYGQNAYLYDSTDDGVTRYDRVLFAPTKDGNDRVADLARGEWADVKVAIVGGALTGLTAGFLIKVEELDPDLSRVRLFHSSVTRARASWPGWPGEPGFTGDFAEYVAQEMPTSTSADSGVVQAGIVSEETYVEQGLYWETFARPLVQYVIETHRPDLVMVGYPITADFSAEFLGLVTRTLPNGDPNPAFDDEQGDGARDYRVAARNGFLRAAYRVADETLAWVQSLMPANATTFVASDHGMAPQFLAVDASRVLVDLGLLSRPQTANCRLAAGETIGRAKACWTGATVQIYLNLAGRDPAGGGIQQVPAGDYDATVAAIRTALEGLSDASDWTGDGLPEGWRMIDRAFSKAAARYVANGPSSSADMAHPTRTGDVVAFAYPPYQFDGATPGTPVSRSGFFGQQGFAPELRLPAANVNLRATFLAGGEPILHTHDCDLRTIDLAPTIAYLMRIPAPQHAQGVVGLECLCGGRDVAVVPVVGLTDFHGRLDPTSLVMDGRSVSVGGAAQLATMFDEERAQHRGATLLLSSGDHVGASPANSGLLQDMPAIDVANAWGLAATAYGNHEFDYGLGRLLAQQARASFFFLGANIVESATGLPPDWARGMRTWRVAGVPVGVIGIALESTPELVPPGNIAGLSFLPAIDTIRRKSMLLRRRGVKAQIVLIHDGSTAGANAVDGAPAADWEGPIVDIVAAIQDTSVDAVFAGHTHRISNMRVGRIPVLQGLNAGASYSVAELLVDGGEVHWVGGATRVAKNLGVAARADVQAVVDDANAQAAVLGNAVIGTQAFDILRAPTRLFESAMGNLVADAMRLRYPGVDAALTNSGGLRADLRCNPPSAGEGPCEITWLEVFSVLPFGNRTVIETLTGAQLETAFLNGFAPSCNAAISTGRFPQVSGLVVSFGCSGGSPVVTGMWLAPDGPAGALTPIAAADEVRVVTNDFLFAGGDGYTVLGDGTDVAYSGDVQLELTVNHIAGNSPVAPVVEGRIVGP